MIGVGRTCCGIFIGRGACRVWHHSACRQGRSRSWWRRTLHSAIWNQAMRQKDGIALAVVCTADTEIAIGRRNPTQLLPALPAVLEIVLHEPGSNEATLQPDRPRLSAFHADWGLTGRLCREITGQLGALFYSTARYICKTTAMAS